tara:strand:+ start:71 stop:826 length:756 start_codon:yes stop_codon:yes gene_type:complete
MKKNIILFFLMLVVSQLVHSKEKITLLVGEWPPFITEELEGYGVGGKLVKRAFEKKDIKVKFQFTSWENAFNWTKKGKKGDGTFFWSKTKEREEDFLFSIPAMIERNVFFHLKGKKIRWKKLKDLRFKKIGIVEGFSYGADLDLAISEGKFKKIIFTKTTLQNFDNLLKRKIDLFPHEKSVGYYELKENYPKYKYRKVIHNEKDIGKDYTYLLMSKKKEKKAKRLLNIFNQSLAEMMIDGEYKNIFSDKEK